MAEIMVGPAIMRHGHEHFCTLKAHGVMTLNQCKTVPVFVIEDDEVYG